MNRLFPIWVSLSLLLLGHCCLCGMALPRRLQRSLLPLLPRIVQCPRLCFECPARRIVEFSPANGGHRHHIRAFGPCGRSFAHAVVMYVESSRARGFSMGGTSVLDSGARTSALGV